GRRRKEDRIDAAVGLRLLARIGQRVERGAPLARLYGRDGDAIAAASRALGAAFAFSDAAPEPRPVVHAVLRG
ncbi:MAG: hypothetical protein ACYC5O_06420, partial [Anaerolineae bacterium]